MNKGSHLVKEVWLEDKRLVQEFPFWQAGLHLYRRFAWNVIADDWHRVLKVAASFAEPLEKPRQDLKLRWLDIGTGDGSTVSELIGRLRENRIFEVALDCIEPDKKASKLIEANLGESGDGFALQHVWECPANAADFQGPYDLITCIHSSYYLGETEEAHLRVWEKVIANLSPNGTLVVVSLPSSSPFFSLAQPVTYVSYSKADLLHLLFRELGLKTRSRKLHVHYLLDEIIERFRSQAYNVAEGLRPLFAMAWNDPQAALDSKALADFFTKLKEHIHTWRGHKVIDFNDWVIQARISH